MSGKSPFLIGFPILLLSGIALASYAYINTSAVGPTERAGIYLDHAEHDFGEVRQGSVLKAEFVLTNWYGTAIEVQKVGGGCSCQEVSIDKKILDRGESARILVTWKVGSARHRIRETVWVTHTTPVESKSASSQLLLGLTADVKPDIEVNPQQLTFDFGISGKALIQLSAGTQSAIQIKKASSSASLSQSDS